MISGRWTPALLLTLTFMLGLSLGFIVRGFTMTPSWEPPQMGGPGPGGPGPGGPGEEMPPPLFDRMTEELGLTEAQQDELDRILEENRVKLQDLRRDVIQVRTRAISDSTRAAIEALMTPEQMRKYRNFRRQMRRNMMRPGPRQGQRRRQFDR